MKRDARDSATAGAATLAWVLGLSASALLAGCAGAPARTGATLETAAPQTQADHEQRLRALQQAESLYLSGRLKEAQSAFEGLTRTYPRNGEIWFRLGNTLMREGNYDDAAAALQSALAFDPEHGRAALNLSLVRLAQAQSAVDLARARLQADSPQRRQADDLRRSLGALLDAPGAVK